MKRFRNTNGTLMESLAAIKSKTLSEAMNYYKPGCIYLYKKDDREYACRNLDDGLAQFQSFDGHKVIIPLESLGTFLPDVASEGQELIFIK